MSRRGKPRKVEIKTYHLILENHVGDLAPWRVRTEDGKYTCEGVKPSWGVEAIMEDIERDEAAERVWQEKARAAGWSPPEDKA